MSPLARGKWSVCREEYDLNMVLDFTSQAVYTPRRLGALAGVSGNTIGQWARNDLIQPTVSKGLPSNLYSFFDAAEAIAVRWLLDEGFTYKQIHNAIEGARRED